MLDGVPWDKKTALDTKLQNCKRLFQSTITCGAELWYLNRHFSLRFLSTEIKIR